MIDVNRVSQPLILASWTSLQTSTFRERVRVAAEAGFDALGIELETYRRFTSEELPLAEMLAVVHDHGLRILELEAVLGYAVPPDRRSIMLRGGRSYTSPAEVEELCELAKAFGARHLVAVGALDTDVVEDDASERFAELCDTVAPFGLQVALEIHPRTNVPDIATALDVVRGAGRPNGGLNVDSWHHIRGANDSKSLEMLAPCDVVLIQLSDGRAKPTHDYVTEMLHHRELPGSGQFGLDDYLRLLLQGGVSAPVSIEVISDELARQPAREVARRAVESTTNLFARLTTR